VLLFGCSPSNQARNYTKHISELKDNFPRLRVFPDNVREDAINPYFFYNRGFAQGGIILRLSYQHYRKLKKSWGKLLCVTRKAHLKR